MKVINYKVVLSTCLIVLFALNSCKIQEELLFKKDFSGTYKYTVDFGAVMKMATAFGGDSTGTQKIPFQEMNQSGELKQVVEQFEANNAKIQFDEEGVMQISFEFDNLDQLNKAYSRLKYTSKNTQLGMQNNSKDKLDDLKSVPTFEYFKKRGKKLCFMMPKEKLKDTTSTNELFSSSLEKLKDSLKTEMNITFDERTVKKIIPTNMNVESNTNKVTIVQSLLKDTEKKKNQKAPKLIIKLK